MMVDVHLADGRTMFRFVARAQMTALLRRKPQDLGEGEGSGSVRAWALWSPGQTEFVPVRLQHVRPASVSFVRQVEPEERDAFLAGLPEDQRPARYTHPAAREPEPAAA